MNTTNDYIKKLLETKKKVINNSLLHEFSSDETYQEKVQTIIDIQNEIMANWEVRSRIIEFKNESVRVPNGTQNIEYSHTFDTSLIQKHQIISFDLDGLDELGLTFDKETGTLAGMPETSGNFKIKILFNVKGEGESAEQNEKLIDIVFNPDPKLLWKNIPSDTEAIFWKEENSSISDTLGEKSIIISSKRGRSHQNDGTFRDDDFAYKHFDENDWSVIAVSDGAGSASFSREGSKVACNEIISYFENEILPSKELDAIEAQLDEFSETKNETILTEAENEAKKVLYKAVLHAHNKINELAQQTFEENEALFNRKNTSYNAEYFHATLIVTAIKKTKIGYVILTFGVGDCPIGIVNKDKTEARLLNWLDVGEFGGGTRFITQPSIFHSKERPMVSRFNMHIQEDFSHLFLMTDGIYDPKFEVEANLEKTEKWLEFIDDLEGKNEDKIGIDFSAELPEAEAQLNNWMDFWSKGNHDDRTLAIIY
ncbi:hypothetical protein IMCC3317_30840 [Kordia antarctica]|uniref:PPM-type phosphatase domain-containing protein n=1 Tax=Kordia antarctica TaxID=1218801 RepID=A0A7L4ZLY1_9FLAO|nr:PP2C family serine/threonine-protein phosphatase [Kordia antarctica]QHI37703.1 hypothetical protein IMCC3317_30840 [Kordia antarctica]